MKLHSIVEYLARAGRGLVTEFDRIDAKLEGEEPDLADLNASAVASARHVAIVPLVEQVRAVLPMLEGLSLEVAGAEQEDKRADREAFVQKLAADLLIKSMATIATPKSLGGGADVTFKFLDPELCVQLARKVYDQGAAAWGEPTAVDAETLVAVQS